jgi:hypothetical protein
MTNSRRGLRFIIAFVAILVACYLTEIYFMGAPGGERHSPRVYDRKGDPAHFWTQFAIVALIEAVLIYACLDWKRALAFLEAADEQSRGRYRPLAPKNAPESEDRRFLSFLIPIVILFAAILLAAFLALYLRR